MFDKTLRLFDDHFGHGNVARGRFVKGGGDHLALHGPLHIGDFFGAFVDQKHDQVTFGMVHLDRAGNVLEQNRLTRARRRDDQGPLALADGRNKVDDPRRPVLDRGILDLHLETLIRIKRREVVECDFVAGAFGILEIDAARLHQGKVAFVFAGGLDQPFDGVAGAQRIQPDDFRRDVNIVRTRQVVCLGRAEKTEPVLQNLKNAIAADLPAFIRAFAQDLEHHLAFAHGGGVFDLQLLGHGKEVLGALRLEIGEIEGFNCHGKGTFAGHVRMIGRSSRSVKWKSWPRTGLRGV